MRQQDPGWSKHLLQVQRRRVLLGKLPFRARLRQVLRGQRPHEPLQEMRDRPAVKRGPGRGDLVSARGPKRKDKGA